MSKQYKMCNPIEHELFMLYGDKINETLNKIGATYSKIWYKEEDEDFYIVGIRNSDNVRVGFKIASLEEYSIKLTDYYKSILGEDK